jgi:hypothetical protein
MPFHEGKACDAVVRVIEAREGHDRRDISSPEKDGDPAPIELMCRIGDQLFAFEHTGIEPFGGHVKLLAEAKRHFDPIRDMLVGKLPSDDYFELVLPAKATQGIRTRELGRIQAIIADWVAATALTIDALPSFEAYSGGARNVKLPDVPFEVSLFRFLPIPPFSGYFHINHQIHDDDLKIAREERIREACVRKFPKLDVWRKDRGARTILVFETNDWNLTNAQRVFDVLSRVEDAMSGKPDEIYLVSTMAPNPWFVHALRIGSQSYYRLSELKQCLTEFDSSILDDLTGRSAVEHPQIARRSR